MLSKKQILIIFLALAIGIIVAAGILALVIGFESPLYLPWLIGSSVALAVLVVFSQKGRAEK